jgi:hypothetical protein
MREEIFTRLFAEVRHSNTLTAERTKEGEIIGGRGW